MVSNDCIFIARFAAKLLQTKMVERSNSVRGRFLNILRETVAIHCASIPEIRFVRDTLASTSPFDSNEGNFRACVRDVISCIGQAPASVIGEIASTIRRLLTEAGYDSLLESTLKALKNKEENERLGVLLGAALLEQHVIDARKNIQDFLGPKSEERERFAKIIDESINELREKFGVPAAQ